MDDTNSLPNDLTQCHQLLLAAYKQSVQLEQQAAQAERRVATSQQQVAELKRVLDETAASFEELKQEHAATLDELAWHKRWAFGRRRERFTEGEGQGHLFDLDPPIAIEPEDSATSDEGTEIKGHHRRKRRQIDWDKLRQIHHEHDLSDEEKVCSCCNRTMDRIGEDVTRELEYEPAKLEAHIHTRPKYACRYCKDGVSAAPLPRRPIPGGIAGPGLITEVLVGKFGDHLPLHRLEDILTRYGVFISRSTMSGWMKAVAELLWPLYDLQRKLVLQSSLMWTDDTPITVLGGPKGSFRGYFWVYIGDKEYPYSVYDFTNSHSRDGPASFLEGYSGYLHADAYTGYDSIFSAPGSSIIEVACWSHTRSRFFKAVGSNPRQSHQVLEWVRQLYDIEDRARS
jgi:transposase